MRNLDLHPVKTTDKSKQKDNARDVKPKSILESFEYIVELAEDSNLNNEFLEKAATYIKYASRKLKLTAMQVVLLAMFVDRSEASRIMISEIAKYTGCRTTKILRLSDDIDVLESKHYLRASRSRKSLSYHVPGAVLKSLRKNQSYVYEVEPVQDTQTFFDRFDKLMNEMDDNEQTHESLMEQTLDMLEEIKDTTFATELRRCGLGDEDTLLFVFMAHLYVENNDDNIGFHDIDDIFDDSEIPSWVKREFRSRDSELFEKELIENVNEDGMARSDAFKLTDKAKEELLCELNLNKVGKSDRGLIKADTLSEKNLIYNISESEQIAELSSILSEKRFTEVQSRLRSAGMRPGFCCIFYGAPGTGKTETVYQIARRTGRDIMRVDVDRIKSCWVGESEKNIKALFDRYRNICKNSKIAPILLFNEADAVLGVRMEGAARAVDKMENSIQNIILQEMETLEGIMIATTNLTTNLDKAFERRFIYKICFDKPSLEARTKIWQTMLSGLSEVDARVLASQFDLSGGEIENIVRKHSVNAILSGNDSIDIKEIMASCCRERISQNNRPKIGF
ncbi:ATP-binding protein [Muribaculum sp.]|uniref:ATP-binding protein n=1 Tax=Muribaculum sp. TaxID=1918611 RepID=UPI0023CC180E|nr:ATP-binding protein [Muribaculum sp.]MDE5705127.1 ATP-binding protein [Muribaculum sp.]